MKEYDIHKLLRKHLTGGDLNPKESQDLNTWTSQSPSNKEVLDALKKIWQERSGEPELINTDHVIDKIWHQGIEKDKKHIRTFDWNYFTKIAAVIAVFIIASVYIFNVNQYSSSEKATAYNTTIVKENPAGQKSKINLPDGSIVWLNGASSISYSSGFNEAVRSVELQGEAFFDVFKDHDKPFVVKSGNIKTTAIGTSFNIEAYLQQDKIKVSLVSGRVKVEQEENTKNDVTLSPGYEVIYHTQTQSMDQQPFSEMDVIGWIEGQLVFNKADYYEVMQKLERWYGVQIKTMGSPPYDWKLTTSYKDENLVNILKNLRFGKEFNYELKKDVLIIKFE